MENEVGDYTIVGSLGSGQSGKVKLAKHKITGELVAIKMFQKPPDNDQEILTRIHREAAILGCLDHPHIVRLISVFESHRYIHLVLELAENRELYDLMIRERQIKIPVAMKLFRQIIYALDYMHQLNICHRDLKPENIFLDYAWNIKIGDFGFAAWMRGDICHDSCGSPHYAAPEIISGSCYFGEAVDVWSCGVILFAMIAGFLPFDNPDIMACMEDIKKGKFEMPNFHPDIKDLIARMLTVDHEKRIRIKDIKTHPAFSIGLPPGYILPVPIPVNALVDPINTDSCDPKVFKTMKEIGFTDAEIEADLAAPWHTQAKVFFQAITKSASMEQFLWSEAQHFKLVVPSGAPSVDSVGQELTDRVPGDDPFKRGVKLSTSDDLPVKYSWASIPDWIVEEKKPILYVQEQQFEDIRIQCDTLVARLQRLLSDVRCDWFFPDDTRIVARHETGAFITFDVVHQDAECVGNQMIDVMTLFVRMNKGTVGVFEEIGQLIRREFGIDT